MIGLWSEIRSAVGHEVLFAEPIKSGKRSSLSRSRRKSHESGLAAIGFRLKGES
jgi:hypothetical protein